VKSLFDVLRKPAPATIMVVELDEARRALLEAMSAREYASAMVLYHETRIDRLRAMLDIETHPGVEQ
jgi:hypothetical protein